MSTTCSVSAELSELGASLLLVRCRTVKVCPSPTALRDRLSSAAGRIENSLSLSDLEGLTPVAAYRAGMQRLGRNPNRHRISSEALFRRVIQGKGVYRINNVVDLNNYMCLCSGLPVGSYDVSAIQGTIELLKAPEGTLVETISKGRFDLGNSVVLADEAGPFGSPINDSSRCMIRPSTRELAMAFYAFSVIDVEKIEEELSTASRDAGVSVDGCELVQ